MIELLVLFVLLLLTTLARFLVFGAFEPTMLAMIFLIPVAAFVIFIMNKKFANQERFYKPKNIAGWSFYNIQKSLLISKPLYKGYDKRGSIKRYFPQKWKYALGDIFGFNWYLSLEIRMDANTYDVCWYRKKWFSNQDQWKITLDRKQIGEARTLFNLKNSTKLKEAIQYDFADKSLISSASTVTSTISLTHNEETIGTLKRNKNSNHVQEMEVKDDCPEYLIALIIHSYYFKNK